MTTSTLEPTTSEIDMNTLQGMIHFSTTALTLYAVYVAAASAAFGGYLWKRL